MNRTFAYLLIAGITGFAIWMWMPSTPDKTSLNLADIKIPELSQPAKTGKSLFDKTCAQCHGENAVGVDRAGPPLIHKIYEPGHHGDQTFILAAARGVRSHHWKFGDMPPVEGIKRAEIEKIVTYIRELQRANGIF
ncbi:MAG: cytochrome c [Hyphomicrobiales bacterium]|nr:cytochrome c [Hyphomicrobiales bacterium]